MIRRLAAPGLLIALLVACTSDSSTTTAASDTTSTTTTIATTTSVPLVPVGSPTEAATALLDAWKAGDMAAAHLIAVDAAVQALFAAGEPGSVQSRGCSDAKYDPAQCVYKSGVGEVQIRTTMQNGGWIVDNARVSAD